jgi:hypothetical protein
VLVAHVVVVVWEISAKQLGRGVAAADDHDVFAGEGCGVAVAHRV